MIAHILWFSAGFITSALYADEIKAWVDGLETKITDTSGKVVDFELLKKASAVKRGDDALAALRRRKESRARELYIKDLINETMERLGLDTKEANMNKTISQISRAASEAYDKYGEPGTKAFMAKWNEYTAGEKKE